MAGLGYGDRESGLLLLLEYPDHVSSRIAKARGDLRCIASDRLHDLASVGGDQINGGGHAVDHDVNQKAWCSGRRAPKHPRAADFVDSIVKRDAAIAPLPNIPAKDTLVEVGGAGNVGGRHFDIANLAVGERGSHSAR